ncbi:hypothetical protein CC80DRAFT_430783 [Byssothecium circinans]|uniref:DUF2406 domain-containing protein n=1 Tax=Byssothecium circinans TaxID=147558 RepID=A0A6A5T9A6_9PLEO|nr:hypothetical protein CC80DRAFT_430783 [Byssothecium circinans]
MENGHNIQQTSSRPSHQRNRTLSFGAKSTKSAGHHSRKESHDEKQHLHPATKADPNAAMNESQPIAAALEKPTLQSLRSFQHTDAQGNPIAEPDLSNPTRSRWERPLDTIRSFEAAIDGEYRRRAQTMRAGDVNTDIMSGYGSHRSSYYGGGYDQNRYSQTSGYYGNRQSARDSWVDNGHGMGGPVGGPSRTRQNRMQSDPGWNRYSNGNGHSVYPTPGYQQSRDTVHTNGSSGSHSDPYSNDPSSDNSSVERAPPVRQPDLGEQYGFQGFGGAPIMEEHGQNNSYFVQQQQSNGYGGAVPPPVPAKAGPPPPPVHNQPMKLARNTSNDTPPTAGAQARLGPEKRRSWFKRRFSKD